MTFPAPHTVSLSRFTGTGEDGLGNPVKAWAAPVQVQVIAYQPAAAWTVTTGFPSTVRGDVDMAVPPSLQISIHDRVLLPDDPSPYEVLEVEVATGGFHGWQPGNVVKLKRVGGV